MRPNKDLIDDRFFEALTRWISSAIEPGHFLEAVLENNLKEAFARGDEGAIDNLPHIVAWLYNDAPDGCWGSPARVRDWAKSQRAKAGA